MACDNHKDVSTENRGKKKKRKQQQQQIRQIALQKKHNKFLQAKSVGSAMPLPRTITDTSKRTTDEVSKSMSTFFFFWKEKTSPWQGSVCTLVEQYWFQQLFQSLSTGTLQWIKPSAALPLQLRSCYRAPRCPLLRNWVTDFFGLCSFERGHSGIW